MCFHGLTAHFFSVLKDTALSGWTTVYLSITYWQESFLEALSD